LTTAAPSAAVAPLVVVIRSSWMSRARP
jgi:hypothetical protein